MSFPAIEVKEVWFSYGRETVLENVNITLKERDFLGVIGPNGGGKTTLLKVLLGLLKPSRGEVRVLGGPPESVMHRIGYMPQDTGINKNFPISVTDAVLMGALSRSSLMRGYRAQDRERADQLIRGLNLWDCRRRFIGQLSGGQRQKVLLARALISGPELLLLDEPTASIDSRSRTEIYDYLNELNKSATIVVVMHEVLAVSSYIKSIACVNRKLIFHEQGKITREMMDEAYQCPVDLIAHGIPHRVFHDH